MRSCRSRAGGTVIEYPVALLGMALALVVTRRRSVGLRPLFSGSVSLAGEERRQEQQGEQSRGAPMP